MENFRDLPDKDINSLINKLIIENDSEDQLIQKLIEDQSKILFSRNAVFSPPAHVGQKLIESLHVGISNKIWINWILPGIMSIAIIAGFTYLMHSDSKIPTQSVSQNSMTISGNESQDLQCENVNNERQNLGNFSQEEEELYFSTLPQNAENSDQKVNEANRFTSVLYPLKNKALAKLRPVSAIMDQRDLSTIEIENSHEYRDSIEIIISPIGKPLNSPFSDFAPILSADGNTMLFTSYNSVTEREIKRNKPSKENIYISHYNRLSQKWDKPELLTNVNEAGRNNSAISLSFDGKTMLMYRDSYSGNGDIYQSIFEKGQWLIPVKLPEPVNSEYHESSACFSVDGNTIYFCSDRDGGFGGKDIWFSEKSKNGEWGKAVNMGPQVNSKEDEEGVSIHPDGKTIYFSSRGHNSRGGYDIFKSQLREGAWTLAQNLGAPVNSNGDDLYYVMSGDGESAYYSSDKSGGIGGIDIYKIKYRSVYENLSPQKEEEIYTKKINPMGEIRTGLRTEGARDLISPFKFQPVILKSPHPFTGSEKTSNVDTTAFNLTKQITWERPYTGNAIFMRSVFFELKKSSP